MAPPSGSVVPFVLVLDVLTVFLTGSCKCTLSTQCLSVVLRCNVSSCVAQLNDGDDGDGSSNSTRPIITVWPSNVSGTRP